MEHRDLQLIRKIISECQDILRYIGEVTEDEFLCNDIYQKATAMSLLNIGEHTNVLSRDLWDQYKDIPWRKIVDLRNIVAHGYGELRMELVWNLAHKEVPQLLDQLKNLI